MMNKKVKSLCLCAFVPLCLYISFTGSAFAFPSSSSGLANPTTPVSARPSLSPTVPVSSYNTGSFVTSPSSPVNPNQIITGNVPGFNYFHGAVPYTSQGSFIGNLPSTSLDFFRRYNAPAGQPFYSPTATSPALLSAQSAPSEKIRLDTSAGQIPYSLTSPTAPPSQSTASRYLMSSYDLYNRSLLGNISGYKFPDQFINLKDKTQTTRETTPEQVSPLPSEIVKSTLLGELIQKMQPEKSLTSSGQIKNQIEQLNKLLEQQSITEQANKKIQESIDKSWQEKLKRFETESDSLSEKFKKLSAAAVQTPPSATSAGSSGVLKPLPRTPEVEKDFEKKADEQMIIAYKLLKEQNFYPASDTFTRASLYQPGKPEGYAGKAFALFAAGDYMYASQLLAIALELSPDYAKTTLDLADLLGSKTKLDERIADLRNFASQNNSGRLYFLLAFLQFKTSQLPQAKASIEQTLKLMPDEPSFKSLKSAIDSPPSK